MSTHTATETHAHSYVIKSSAPNERGTMTRTVWACQGCPETRVERERITAPVEPFKSRAMNTDGRRQAAEAYADLVAATPTDAEVILMFRVEEQRDGIAALRKYREYAPRGILHPDTIRIMLDLLTTFEPRLDEAMWCAAAVALGTRGHNVHGIAPVDFPALLDALAAEPSPTDSVDTYARRAATYDDRMSAAFGDDWS